MRSPFRISISVMAVIGLLFFSITTAHAKPARLVILPLNVYSQENLDFLKEGVVNMLTSRFTLDDAVTVVCPDKTRDALAALSGPIETEGAVRAARSLAADYVFFGNLTQFGEGMSIDARMLDVKGEKSPLVFFEQCQTLDEVIPRISRFAGAVNKKVFNRVTYTEEPTVEETRKRVEQYAHPEKLMGIQPAIDEPAEEPVPAWKVWKRFDFPTVW